MKIYLNLGIVAAALSMAAPAQSTTLLTSAVGYTGTQFTIPAFYGDPANFLYFTGPLSLGSGVSIKSNAPNQSDIGVISTGGYGLSSNGNIFSSPYIGLDDGKSTMTITFDTPVASFGLGITYAVNADGTIPDNPAGSFGNDPVISAYDASNALIASYDLLKLAPISTPNGTDQFQFRGISSTGAPISSFQMSGAFISGQAQLAVPEPATWVLLLTSLGVATFVAGRGRRSPSV